MGGEARSDARDTLPIDQGGMFRRAARDVVRRWATWGVTWKAWTSSRPVSHSFSTTLPKVGTILYRFEVGSIRKQSNRPLIFPLEASPTFRRNPHCDPASDTSLTHRCRAVVQIGRVLKLMNSILNPFGSPARLGRHSFALRPLSRFSPTHFQVPDCNGLAAFGKMHSSNRHTLDFEQNLSYSPNFIWNPLFTNTSNRTELSCCSKPKLLRYNQYSLVSMSGASLDLSFIL